MATLKFSPGHIVVTSGETLTFQHDDATQDPHTLSIVNAADVPATIDDVFSCGEPGTVCDDVFQAVGQALGGEPTGSQFVNISGGSGLDGRLDTIFLLPGDSVSATVTAPSGSTLYFICAIHAWMQGTITVK
jgi:plastocyanin